MPSIKGLSSLYVRDVSKRSFTHSVIDHFVSNLG
jgi:hypothetical protein